MITTTVNYNLFKKQFEAKKAKDCKIKYKNMQLKQFKQYKYFWNNSQ